MRALPSRSGEHLGRPGTLTVEGSLRIPSLIRTGEGPCLNAITKETIGFANTWPKTRAARSSALAPPLLACGACSPAGCSLAGHSERSTSTPRFGHHVVDTGEIPAKADSSTFLRSLVGCPLRTAVVPLALGRPERLRPVNQNLRADGHGADVRPSGCLCELVGELGSRTLSSRAGRRCRLVDRGPRFGVLRRALKQAGISGEER
jgi:hypothetical protein